MRLTSLFVLCSLLLVSPVHAKAKKKKNAKTPAKAAAKTTPAKATTPAKPPAKKEAAKPAAATTAATASATTGEGEDGVRFFNLSLTPSIAIYERTDRVEGFTLSIWGENQTHGVSLGFVNGTRGDSLGFQFGLVNYGETYTGAQISVVNYLTKDCTGFQGGGVNVVRGTMVGFQWAFVNYAEKLGGVQLGIVNYAKDVDTTGIQVGIVNVMPINKSWFGEFPKAVAPFFIIANWRFT